MSYLLVFLAGMQFCLALVLMILGHVGAASKCLCGAGACLFMAWVWAKYPPARADSATERKS